ncbi:hypothetical protein GCM10018980_48430 [Streptomyces capoamus]|uniref:Uncharacterized protein n=1 Tax=Streptomyces capoamus TaxID=68183 RepID=A0A919KCV1_9ACTN|nr:hypothetical protein GCM10018980_48430 [Streptomyces capoamus]
MAGGQVPDGGQGPLVEGDGEHVRAGAGGGGQRLVVAGDHAVGVVGRAGAFGGGAGGDDDGVGGVRVGEGPLVQA